jgi:hypothetical protein
LYVCLRVKGYVELQLCTQGLLQLTPEFGCEPQIFV